MLRHVIGKTRVYDDVFTVFDSNEIGFTEKYLQHARLGSVASSKAIIKRVEVIVKHKKGTSLTE